MTADVTQWLAGWRAGDRAARDRLIAALYPELRQQAGRLFRNERGNHTLQPTALVGEAWLRLSGQHALAGEDRSHLVAAAVRLMREILIDHARARSRVKRDGGERVSLTAVDRAGASAEIDVLDLDGVLQRLEAIDPDKARIVELRYFGGLSIEETAVATGQSPATVKRHWQAARIWLLHALEGGHRAGHDEETTP